MLLTCLGPGLSGQGEAPPVPHQRQGTPGPYLPAGFSPIRLEFKVKLCSGSDTAYVSTKPFSRAHHCQSPSRLGTAFFWRNRIAWPVDSVVMGVDVTPGAGVRPQDCVCCHAGGSHGRAADDPRSHLIITFHLSPPLYCREKGKWHPGHCLSYSMFWR